MLQHKIVSTRLVDVKCYDIYRKVLIIPMELTPNIVIKKLKEIHFVSEIIAVAWREELIHIGCLPFSWLYNKFVSPLLKTAASFSQPLFALFCLFSVFVFFFSTISSAQVVTCSRFKQFESFRDTYKSNVNYTILVTLTPPECVPWDSQIKLGFCYSRCQRFNFFLAGGGILRPVGRRHEWRERFQKPES